MSERVLVTGASGFVGSILCERLAEEGYRVRAAVRTDRPMPRAVGEQAIVGEIGAATDWGRALEGVDHVIHAAARVHVMHDSARNADLYAETNARGTLQLATEAARAGVRRFIYLSTVKVNGEDATERPYTSSDTPNPHDAYGQSKWQAEQHVREVAARGGLQFAVVRPPLVYGPGVRANFLRLLGWVDRERPLPLGSIQNRRSLVSVWNLTDLMVSLLRHPQGAGRVWMVSDDHDLSTPDLIRRIAHSMSRRARLLPIPVPLLRLMGAMTGKSAEIARLCGSLCVDVTPAREILGWRPPVSVDEGLARTTAWYLTREHA